MEKVASVEDVQLGILEPSGRLTLALKPEKAPATKEDIQKLLEILTDDDQPQLAGNEKISPLFKNAYQEAKTKRYQQH